MGKLLAVKSVLTRTADTNAYIQSDFIANAVLYSSVVVPSFEALKDKGGSLILTRAKLLTNKTSGMGAAAFAIDLWDAAPTVAVNHGDNGAYLIDTGVAHWLGRLQTGVMTQMSDGAFAVAEPVSALSATSNGFPLLLANLAGTLIYWTLTETDATGFTPASAQTFTLIPEGEQV